MKTKNIEDVTCLVHDNGLFVDVAAKLAQTFKKVFYYVPWESSFPKMNAAWIGKGIEGIEVVSSPFREFFDQIDLFCFPDVYQGPLQDYLVSQGKTVWGSRMGEELELCREWTKEQMAKKKLPVGKYVVLTGMKALREHIKTHKDQYIKMNNYRGTFETFSAPDYKSVEPKLDEVEYNLGAFKDIVKFIVEDALPDKVEVGCDMYTIDGKYPERLLSGIEIKDLAYVGKFGEYKDLPEAWTRWNTAFAPMLKSYGYRGFMSTELRIGMDKEPYMIDFCARAPSPPNELYQELYSNLAEIIWEGANGNLVSPKPIAKFGAEVLIHSTWADRNWQPVDFPDKYRQNIKLRNAVRINGRYYVIPQSVGLPEIGAVIGWGNTLDEAIAMVTKISKEVSGYYIDIPLAAFDDAQREIKNCEKYGVSIF